MSNAQNMPTCKHMKCSFVLPTSVSMVIALITYLKLINIQAYFSNWLNTSLFELKHNKGAIG